MNKALNMVAMTGMAVVAGAMFSAGPSAAASAAPAPTTTKATATTQASSKIVGFYRSRGACERAGRIGERRDRWDDHDCYRIRSGHHRSLYALRVSWDHRGHGHGQGHGHDRDNGHDRGNRHGHRGNR
jgi:hypothetical protein